MEFLATDWHTTLYPRADRYLARRKYQVEDKIQDPLGLKKVFPFWQLAVKRGETAG